MIKVAREHQSSETKFIHVGDTIPVYENFLFILALCQSKTMDNIREASRLLHKLLAYQNEGVFPVRLHDYPFYYDRWHAVKLLRPFTEIYENFRHVIGIDLEKPYADLLGAIEKTLAKNAPDYLTQVQTGKDLDLLQIRGKHPSWNCTESLGLLLTCVQWPELISHAEAVWDGRYTGPHIQEWHVQGSPEKNLFHYIMGGEEPTNLRAVLQRTLVKDRPEVKLKNAAFSLSLVDQKESFNEKGFHSLYLAWDGASLCSQGVNPVVTKHTEKGAEMLFDCEEEIAFYLSRIPLNRANTFKLSEPVTIGPVTLTFTLVQGTGDFMGHIALANRPSEKDKSGEVYDWKIFLRSLRMSPDCKINVLVEPNHSFINQ